MARVFNFSAGPSVLPEPVLKRAAAELVEYPGSGQSVMEMSHRSREYEEIISRCEALLRSVMGIPEQYEVLFLQGGASLQFSMLPLNLLTGSKKADLIHTGVWSGKAKKEIAKVGTVRVVASGEESGFTSIPEVAREAFDPDADFVYLCENNTIYGTKYPALPDTGSVPIAADLSSCILSEPIDVSKYGVLFAGAQKNMGPAGLTVVILRKDLLGRAPDWVPSMLNYQVHAENHSMFNTPPTYSVYVCGLVLEWLQDEIGGLEGMQALNRKKAALLYDFLDHSKLFRPTVTGPCRSLMNIPFVTGNQELDAEFVSQAAKAGFLNLKGHRLVGGMRASIYNAMPLVGVAQLVDFMNAFEQAKK